MATTGSSVRRSARRVHHFVHGTHRLAITSQSLADLLGLLEEECRLALEAMTTRGLLRKVTSDHGAPLYCKE